MKVVVVHWLDTLSDRAQVSLKQALGMKPVPIVSSGILVRDDDEGIVLSQDILHFDDDDIAYRDTEMIPKAYITSIEIKDFNEHSND